MAGAAAVVSVMSPHMDTVIHSHSHQSVNILMPPMTEAQNNAWLFPAVLEYAQNKHRLSFIQLTDLCLCSSAAIRGKN